MNTLVLVQKMKQTGYSKWKSDAPQEKEEEKMKLMNLLDCMSQYAYITLADINGITIFIGKVSDVPEKFWDDIVYLIIPEGNINNISIY